MATFRDLLAAAKNEITEIDTAAAAERIAAGAVVLDVREPDEYDQGALAGAIHIPRGHLEAQVEGRILDKNAPVVVYCAGGVRSAFAARFKAVVGDTPADYLAHWRLTLAQAHLRAGRSLKSIAHELGYANPSALSRVFAQKLGMSARDWREAVDEGR